MNERGFTLDLKDINNVNDLIELNNQQTDADVIVDRVMEAGIVVGHEVTLRLVTAAIDFHKKILAEKATDEDLDPCAVILWTKDLTNLQNARELLKTIDLGQEED